MEVAASNDALPSSPRTLSVLLRPLLPGPSVGRKCEDSALGSILSATATMGGGEDFRRGDVTGERGGEYSGRFELAPLVLRVLAAVGILSGEEARALVGEEGEV